MPKDSKELIAIGYVVGSNKKGKEWIVRLERDPSLYMDKKLKVASVHVGTSLRPGLNVTFTIKSDNQGNEMAYDVEAVIPRPYKPILSGIAKVLAVRDLVKPLINNCQYADAIALCKLAGLEINLNFFEDGTIEHNVNYQ
jgi:hypothetical protein